MTAIDAQLPVTLVVILWERASPAKRPAHEMKLPGTCDARVRGQTRSHRDRSGLTGGTGPFHVFSPTGSFIYVESELDSTITSCRYN